MDDRTRALEAEVRHLRAMLESAPNFITRITLDGNFLYLNQLAPGFRMEDVVGTSIDNYVPEAFRERAREAMRRAHETRAVQEYSTVGQVSADRLGHYLTRVSPVLEDGVVTSLVMIATDVTALAEEHVLLQLALDATGLGIWTHEPRAGVGSWDEATRRIFGVGMEEPAPGVAALMQERIHPEDRARVAQALTQATEGGRYGPIEHRIVLPNGTVRWVAASGITVRGARGEVVKIVGSVQDITERRSLEARLLDAQKLESIGRLAGGVAHDFNNMLTAIIGNVAFAATVESIDEVRPLLTEIRIAAERSAALTAQLLAFARRQVIEPKVVDLNALIQRLDGLLRRLVGERTRVSLSLLATGWVRGGESQLEQVILNLVTNARDALSGTGTVLVETADVVLDRSHAEAHSEVTAGRYVMLTVKDDGPGIAAELLPHLFEPFFTTREGGSGLGLATCYGIVRQSGGHISVHSEVGRGATFKVYLPVATAEAPSVPPPASVRESALTEKVLLVEDERSVRAVMERTLRREGYRVFAAGSADDAFRLADTEGSFELLVTDVAMPDMDGRELAERMLARWPHLRVLYVSGYAQQFAEGGAAMGPGMSFLQKPFKPLELLRAARKVLDSPV